MVYIYKKQIGKNSYYYLRASLKKGLKTITKDIAYLGNDPEEARKSLDKLNKYSKEIKQSYKKINKTLEMNRYLEIAKNSKLKSCEYMSNQHLFNLEACKIHFNNVFKKLNPLTQKDFFKYFIIEFAFNTASIEGNTITLKEAHKLLTENFTPKDRTLREIYDLQNTEKVFFEILEYNKNILNHETICNIHKSLLNNIDIRTGYRKSDVKVFKSKFDSSPAKYVLTDMSMLFKLTKTKLNKLHPFVKAVLFHHKFEKIHPFYDGNGRTGRILMNSLLINDNYPPIIITKKNRSIYLDALSKADNSDILNFEVKNYKKLVEFAVEEMTAAYWDVFL